MLTVQLVLTLGYVPSKAVQGFGPAANVIVADLLAFEDRLMKDLWESESDGWFKKGLKLAGASAVWVLMKILKGILKLLTGAITVFRFIVFSLGHAGLIYSLLEALELPNSPPKIR